jgi:DNA-binding PadR family transcriptional regulator
MFINISIDIVVIKMHSECRRGSGHGCCSEAYAGAMAMRGGMGFGVRKGDFRFLVLLALSEKSMHGYALIQQIGATYQRPVSAGLIYPMLQELGDMGYVFSEENEGKKVYSLTSEGVKYLEDSREVVGRLKAGRVYAERVGRFPFMRDIKDMQAMILMNEGIDDAKLKRIQDILSDAKKRMASIVFE